MINFKCPKCNDWLSVPESMAGQPETCPCGNVSTVPTSIVQTQLAEPLPVNGECTNCGSTKLVLVKRGYDWVSGFIWCLIFFPIGLLLGFAGGDKMVPCCTQCGHKNSGTKFFNPTPVNLILVGVFVILLVMFLVSILR